MTEIEKIKRYIERTNVDDNGRFCMKLNEAMALSDAAQNVEFPAKIIALAFKYGKAKGYRAAKAEVRR